MIKLLKAEEFASARALLEKAVLDSGDRQQLLALIASCEKNNQVFQNKLISESKLKNMVFGAKTESYSGTLFEQTELLIDAEQDAKAPPLPEVPAALGCRRKGFRRGRRDLKVHSQAEIVRCSCTFSQHGSQCPACCKGNVYRDKPLQKTVVQCVNLVVTQIFEIESLRCRDCGFTEQAESPAVVSQSIGKYHFSTIATLAVLRYHGGLPSHRMAHLTSLFGLSIPETTQFRLFEAAANILRPLYTAIKDRIANSPVCFRDDSPMRILEVDPDANKRSSVTVTTLVGIDGDRKWILYDTSTQHAGEVFEKILARQHPNAPPTLAMADAASLNRAHKITNVKELSCLVHARRKFFELQKFEPEETAKPLELISKVYANESKFKNLSSAERLRMHQLESAPLLESLREICQRGVWRRGKNEEITKAFAYFDKHWDRLTGFLKFEGAPLDNNEAERTLKRAIRHRRNSLFYKTENGAAVGDVLMSFIATALANGKNAITLLTEALKNKSDLSRQPDLYLA